MGTSRLWKWLCRAWPESLETSPYTLRVLPRLIHIPQNNFKNHVFKPGGPLSALRLSSSIAAFLRAASRCFLAVSFCFFFFSCSSWRNFLAWLILANLCAVYTINTTVGRETHKICKKNKKRCNATVCTTLLSSSLIKFIKSSPSRNARLSAILKHSELFALQ